MYQDSKKFHLHQSNKVWEIFRKIKHLLMHSICVVNINKKCFPQIRYMIEIRWNHDSAFFIHTIVWKVCGKYGSFPFSVNRRKSYLFDYILYYNFSTGYINSVCLYYTELNPTSFNFIIHQFTNKIHCLI
jgi:hypothetical protein